ncbi:MAG TPA: TonB family protein [Polyangiaceae bacterium]|nr:TonB family protein [Polyangiaceae bacterium]
MNKTLIAPLLLASLCSVACSFAARSPDGYREDTRAVLEKRSKDIKACYDEELKKDKKAGGKVTITFTVAKETGKFQDVKVKESDASEALQACVVKALDGLAIDPADQRDGKATFTYEFKAK